MNFLESRRNVIDFRIPLLRQLFSDRIHIGPEGRNALLAQRIHCGAKPGLGGQWGRLGIGRKVRGELLRLRDEHVVADELDAGVFAPVPAGTQRRAVVAG